MPAKAAAAPAKAAPAKAAPAKAAGGAPAKDVKKDRQSVKPGSALPKKAGAGGKGTWGKLGDEQGSSGVNDPRDPNFESDPDREAKEAKKKEQAEIDKKIAEYKSKLLEYRADPEQKKKEEVNFLKKDDIIAGFPRHIREQMALARAKGTTKAVDIDPFHLPTPFTAGAYLLRDTRLLLEPGKRYCLVGESGTGKSTLFDNISGGLVKGFPKHLNTYHCQELEVHDNAKSLIRTVIDAHVYRNILLDFKNEVKTLMAKDGVTEADMGDYKTNLDFIELQLVRMNSHDAEARAAKMLRVLGFDDAAQQKNTNTLSGGLRMRVALCMAFFCEPDLLLLDEPTNHLDFPSVLWLENQLKSYRNSFVLISHDRDLIENVTNAVMLLENKEIKYYKVGFKEFEKVKAKEDQKYAEEIEKFMNRNRSVDFSSPLAREKAEKQAWQDAFYQRQVMLAGKFNFPPAAALTANEDEEIPLINIKDVRFSYDEAKGLPFIFDTPINLNITSKTRLGVMGPNGAGKSTLLKLITKRLFPTSGVIERHSTAIVAYFAQHHAQELDLNLTPIEYMIEQFPEVKAGLLRSHLQKVGILGNKAETRMTMLSGGQRSCVIFAKITYHCPHLLIMDEPTNFLDLDSVDSLVAATTKYKGALLLVSHNRSFLNKCAKAFLSVVPGQFNMYGDLKNCEKATYTFIAQLEEDGKGGSAKAVANALAKSRGAGDAATVAVASTEKKEFVFGASSTGRAPPVAAKKPATPAAPVPGTVIPTTAQPNGPLCKLFTAGTCQFGATCRNRHVVPQPGAAGRGGGSDRGGRGGGRGRGK